jgi:hypothetical protein
MTAPPEARMPLATTFDPYLHLASSSISPASTVAFDSSFSWTPMPPHQETTGKQPVSHVNVRFGITPDPHITSERGRVL